MSQLQQNAGLISGLIGNIADPDDNFLGAALQLVQNQKLAQQKQALQQQALKGELVRSRTLNKLTEKQIAGIEQENEEAIAKAPFVQRTAIARARQFEALATEAEFSASDKILKAREDNMLATAALSGVELRIAQAGEQGAININAAKAITAKARANKIKSDTEVALAENEYKLEQTSKLNNPDASPAEQSQAFQNLNNIAGRQGLKAAEHKAKTTAQKKAEFDTSLTGSVITQGGRLNKITDPVDLAIFELHDEEMGMNQPQYMKDLADQQLALYRKMGSELGKTGLKVTGGEADTIATQMKSLTASISFAASAIQKGATPFEIDRILGDFILWHPDLFEMASDQEGVIPTQKLPKSGVFGQAPTPTLTITEVFQDLLTSSGATPEETAMILAPEIAGRTGGDVTSIENKLLQGRDPRKLEESIVERKKRVKSRNVQLKRLGRTPSAF